VGRRLVSAFKVELSKIKSDDLRKITKDILLKCNDYCVDMPASSTGKYHPAFDAGTGGLIRHIKVVCRNVETFLLMMPQYDGPEWDIPYIAAILHDCAKYTKKDQQYSHEEHPNLVATIIRQFDHPFIERIAKCAETHMSRWNTCRHSKEVMPTPKNMEHMIVAMADMIAAQKWNMATFDEDNNLTN
jgi:hypothetical protein